MEILGYLSVLKEKTLEHIFLTALALLMASAFAIPIGVWIYRVPSLKNIVLKIGSISQTIPGLAMLALLVPLLGLGNTPTLVVLTFYALYPILRSTYTGLESVPVECIEAARGLGFSNFQRLWIVELPLALPVIISGVRVATAMTIGITTIAAFIGAGGLGDFITQGLALNDTFLILSGAIPAALLALSFDFGISQLETWLQRRKASLSKSSLLQKIIWITSGLIIIGFGASFFHLQKRETLVIASKNFTEQYILAEIMAQLIEAKTSIRVVRKFNLGSTTIVHQAMLKGHIDLYPEYTGTAYLTVLKRPYQQDQATVLSEVQKDYMEMFGLFWLPPFGFSNSQSLAIRKEDAKKYNIYTISDLSLHSKALKIAAPPEFLKRPDAFPGLKKAYELSFKKVMQVDPNLMYKAINYKKVDVIGAFTTDGNLQKYDLLVLKDDKGFYPPYQASPVVRKAVFESLPQLREVLALLEGKISQEKMTTLNALVDINGQSPAKVAKDFLAELGS